MPCLDRDACVVLLEKNLSRPTRHIVVALDSRLARREEAGVADFDCDGAVSGWGFGGSVAARRALENG
jgi:hypothetical protein